GCAAFVCIVSAASLTAIFAQLRIQAERTYNAEFADVSGLAEGDFVRIAGVEVGKVKKISINHNNLAVVEFSAEPTVVLTGGTRAALRWADPIGTRYMSLLEGAGGLQKLNPGGTIAADRTEPALDLDVLLGGFRPLIRALDPEQVNALSSQLIKGLAERKTDISNAVAYTNASSATITDLLTQIREPFKNTVTQSDRATSIVVADHAYFDDLLNTLPDSYKALA